jgi:polyhydroxybutyrate depolymerase
MPCVGGTPRSLRRAAAGFALASLALACSADGITGAGETGIWSVGTASHAVVAGARTRTYLAHVPPKRLLRASLPAPWPLVIVLHGSAGDAASVAQLSAMDSLADANLFLVAYPNGTGGDFDLYPSDWNAGSCCGGAARDNVDDLAFITGLIAQMSAHVPVDARRVYVAGFSAGGRMAYHVGCQLSTTIAAIGVVAGSLVDDACAPAKGVPLFAVHGTDDPEVAFDEASPPPLGTVPLLAGNLPPAVQFWSALGKCTGGTNLTLSEHVVRTSFTACVGAEIQFYAIRGGTHGWPGGPVDPGAQPPMNELRASVLMWQFFNRKVR